MHHILSRIAINPNVCKGKPCMRNMRFTVVQLLELLASGMTFDEILAGYPYLEKEDIEACLLVYYMLPKLPIPKMLLPYSPKDGKIHC